MDYLFISHETDLPQCIVLYNKKSWDDNLGVFLTRDVPFRSSYFSIGRLGGAKILWIMPSSELAFEALNMCPAHNLHLACRPQSSIPCGRNFGPTLGQCQSRAMPSGLRGPVIREAHAIGISAPLNHTDCNQKF